MSTPARDATTVHRREASRAVEHRQRLLEQLYATTLAFLELKTPDFVPSDDLVTFLNINDITQGRPFKTTTLPGADLPEYIKAQPSDFLRDTTQPTHAANTDAASNDSLGSPQGNAGRNNAQSDSVHLAHSSPVAVEEARQVFEDVRPISESQDVQKQSAENVDLNSGRSKQVVDPGECPRPVDRDANNTSIVEKEGIADNLNETVGAQPIAQKPDSKPHDPPSKSTLPGLGHDPSIVTENIGALQSGEDRHDNSSHEKFSRIRQEILSRTSTTPDEQLRLEESQSQLRRAKEAEFDVASGPSSEKESSQPHSASDLPSQFLHDGLIGSDPVADASSIALSSESGQASFSQSQINDEVPVSVARLPSGLRDHVVSGMNGNPSRDLTFSRRPPMRIDTGLSNGSDTLKSAPLGKSTAVPPTPSQAAVLSKSAHPLPNAPSPPERMTTRVSSGALRHKSVSEILGETPKASSNHTDKDDATIPQTPKSASSLVSPEPASFKQRLESKDKERSSKLSTVVFAKHKPTSIPRSSDVGQSQQADPEKIPIKDRDYFSTWITASVFHKESHNRLPLTDLMRSAHKTLTTSDHYTDFREKQDSRILQRIFHLQHSNKWSLRQLNRSIEPERTACHWDVLLSQMRWMRTDFKEERKWKMAGAKHLAESCADWVHSPKAERKLLQVRVRQVEALRDSQYGSEGHSAPTPDLAHSTGDEASEAMEEDFVATQADPPATMFSLPPDVFIFGLNKSPVSDKILQELPLYQPNAEVQDGALRVSELLLDSAWKTPIVPVSKYAQGKIVAADAAPPRKRSRYDDTEGNDQEERPPVLTPENNDVALFNPEHKHIRDRIHAGHAFRPPSEHVMPSQSFFESRAPSQWTMAEDDYLRKLVREYAYNWSLVSSCLSPSSLFWSGAERRTPWECFERWIALEGLPADMSKINYFRAYHSRLQAAARNYEANQQLLMQQNPHNVSQLSRRRSTQPFTVERRKNNKPIHLIDAMRKQAKKRESKAAKDAQMAHTAQSRRNPEPPKPQRKMHTPQEFSQLKHETYIRREEQIKAMRANYIAQQRANLAARNNQQPGQQMPSVQPMRGLMSGAPQIGSPSMAIPHSRGGGVDHSRMGHPMQRPTTLPTSGPVNGIVSNGAQNVPNAPMQPHLGMQMGQRLPAQLNTDNMRIYHEATRVQAEQQAQLQRQRQQQHPQINGQVTSPTLKNTGPVPQTYQNMLASMDGHPNPAMNSTQSASGNVTSPRVTQPQALSGGMTPAVNQISNQIKLRHPQASPEQVAKATTDQLFRMSQAAQQAMQAAAGTNNNNAIATNGNVSAIGTPSPMQQQAMMANSASPLLNPQQYAQMMRQQQGNQQRSGHTGTPAMGGSRSGTPMNQRSGSAQGGRTLSQSPRAGQISVAGGQ